MHTQASEETERQLAYTTAALLRAAAPLFWREQGRSGAQRLAPAAKSMCSEGSLAQPNLQPGSPFFCLLCFGEAKKSKWPRGHEAQSTTIRKWIKITAHL